MCARPKGVIIVNNLYNSTLVALLFEKEILEHDILKNNTTATVCETMLKPVSMANDIPLE